MSDTILASILRDWVKHRKSSELSVFRPRFEFTSSRIQVTSISKEAVLISMKILPQNSLGETEIPGNLIKSRTENLSNASVQWYGYCNFLMVMDSRTTGLSQEILCTRPTDISYKSRNYIRNGGTGITNKTSRARNSFVFVNKRQFRHLRMGSNQLFKCS
jgi:hypothetical protein